MMDDILIQLARLVEDSVPPRTLTQAKTSNIEEVDWESVAKSIGTDGFFPKLKDIWGAYHTSPNDITDYHNPRNRGDAD